MKAGMTLAMVCVAGAILVAGCGQSNSGGAGTSTKPSADAPQSQSSQSSPQKSSVNSVDGYKSFKFGMKPSELAKLAECAPNDYEEKIAAKIVELTESLPIPEINPSAKDSSQAAQLNKEIDKLKNNKEGSYFDMLHCKVNFAGNNQTPNLHFNDQQQLIEVEFGLGRFNQEKLDALIKELQGKYPLSSSPSNAAIATANREYLASVGWFFANNGVVLRLTNFSSTMLMSLHYLDATSAKEAFKESQKGKVSSGDL